jgi:hypothetical protein
MVRSKSSQRTEPDSSVRTLKIEADGDFWKGVTLPKNRLMGRWLERAGHRVQVTCVSPGVIELRSPDATTVNETNLPVSTLSASRNHSTFFSPCRIKRPPRVCVVRGPRPTELSQPARYPANRTCRANGCHPGGASPKSS